MAANKQKTLVSFWPLKAMISRRPFSRDDVSVYFQSFQIP